MTLNEVLKSMYQQKDDGDGNAISFVILQATYARIITEKPPNNIRTVTMSPKKTMMVEENSSCNIYCNSGCLFVRKRNLLVYLFTFALAGI